MPGDMTRAALVADLRASLLDSAKAFTAANDADFVRHLDRAAEAFTPLRPRTLVGTLSLVADQPEYAAPLDMWRYKTTNWGAARGNPWDKTWPGRLPDVRCIDGSLWFVPAPTAHQIAVLGSSFTFFYYAQHAVAAEEANTTIAAADRSLLLLRAQAEAMRELAMRDAVRPTQAQSAFSGQPKTGTPAALSRWFLEEFEASCRRVQ
jgi:hypothetical protein